MDHDIYLILVGAVIATATNILMRLLETFGRHIARRLYFSRAQKLEKKKLRKKLMGLEENNSYKPDFWLELWIDLGKLRAGGGTKFRVDDITTYGFDRPIDYVVFVTQWLITIGIFVYWVVEVMPQMK